MRLSVDGFFSNPYVQQQLQPITITRKKPIKGGQNTRSLMALISTVSDDGKTVIKSFVPNKSASTFTNWKLKIEPGCIISDGEYLYTCKNVVVDSYPMVPTITAVRTGPQPKKEHPHKYFRLHPELCEKLEPVTIESSVIKQNGKPRIKTVNFIGISEKTNFEGFTKVIQLDKTKAKFQAVHFVFGVGCIFIINGIRYRCIEVKYPPTPKFPIVTLRRL